MIRGTPTLPVNPGFKKTFAGAGLALLAGVLLPACSSTERAPATGGFWSSVTPYKVEVVQGNVVTREQAAFLKPGMSRAEVRDIIGSPLLADVFHADRWDYVFSIRRQGATAQQRKVTLVFKGDRLQDIQADELPSERDFNASISTTRKKKAPDLTLSDAEIQALPKPSGAEAAAAAAASAPQAARRSYPPLETRTP